jgi:prolyl-tRNA synthetase
MTAEEMTMRMSSLFGRTLREAPGDVKGASHVLLTRAGMIRQVAPGSYAFLPLGWKVMGRIAAIVREELEALGGQEVWIPDAQPDPRTAFILLAQREIQSYRQLPRFLYQVRTRAREQLDRREGLFRTHQSLALEACSFHADETDLDAQLHRVRDAYVNIFRRCGVDATIVDGGAGLPDDQGYAFIFPHPEGDDQVVVCDDCGYAATLTAAVADKGPGGGGEENLPLEEVATPDCPTIAAVADYLGVPTSQTAKAVFYSLEGELVFVVIRGDLEVNEARLARLLGTDKLCPATEEEIRAVGAEPGYASPVGLAPEVRVIVDDSIPAARNLVAGANRPGYHLRNVNYGRDFTAHQVADIAQVREGDRCRNCGERLRLSRALSLGEIIRTGIAPGGGAGVTFLDRDGQTQVLTIGYYAIALDCVMTAMVAAHHDDYGIIWPPDVAPFDLHLVRLGKDEAVVEAAESVYANLRERGFTVLYDDRDESPGVKFADADLIGVPWRATVSRRSLAAGGVELKARWETTKRVVPAEELTAVITRTKPG